MATGGGGTASSPSPTGGGAALISGVSTPVRWAIGVGALWVVLTAMTESDVTAELAAALAVLIASSAAFIYLPGVFKTLGLGG